MLVHFSLPIVCYLKSFNQIHEEKTLFQKVFKPNNLQTNAIWVSNIFDSNNVFIGYRYVELISENITCNTYNALDEHVSTEILSNIDDGYIETITTFNDRKKPQLKKSYVLIDNSIIECSTIEVWQGEIKTESLKFETLTSEPIDGATNWVNICKHDSWFCFLKDGDHREVGTRQIWIGSADCALETSYDKLNKRQSEYLNLVPNDAINKHGTIENYRNFLKRNIADPKVNMSRGGIVLDVNLSLEHHKEQAKKTKV